MHPRVPESNGDEAEAHRRATYAVTDAFFATLVANGVGHVVVSPGSRSTPLAIAAHRSGARIWIHHDERVGAFFALGLARATRAPVALVCTSGTAGANYLPAVVEANHGGHPLIVCTADRPPELRGWGAGQTIDQLGLYGTHVRWFHELPVASTSTPAHAARVALRAVATATGPVPGPVHLNWPFREPLEPPATPAPPAAVPVASVASDAPPPPAEAAVAALAGAATAGRGVVVVGPADLPADAAAAVVDFATAAGWPIVADPASGLRAGPTAVAPLVLSAADLVLATPSFAGTVVPDVVVRVGASPVCKPYRLWVEQHRPARLVLTGGGTEWADPTDSVTDALAGDVALLFGGATRLLVAGPGPAPDHDWRSRWVDADTAAAATRAADPTFSELSVAGVLAEVLPPASTLMVSNSMPIRDLDTGFPRRAEPLRIVANRGANGIDGIVATAAGHAAADPEGPAVTVFLGDIALLHDLGGVAASRRLGLPLVLVVVDNDGGGIFSFLPIAEASSFAGFTELFHTPHGTDLAAVAALGGMRFVPVAGPDDLAAALRDAHHARTPSLVAVSIEAATNRQAFRALRDAVAERLERSSEP